MSIRRGTPILRIGLRGHEFDELLIGSPAANEITDGLRVRSNR